MMISEKGTAAMVKNLRSEGSESRATYLELMQLRINELEQQLKATKPKLYRHLKTDGIYELVAIAQNESNLTSLVIYKSVDTGVIWARPHKEFFDGRFEQYTSNLEGK